MIKIENTEIVGWQAAIRGMRNPLESWDKSDSFWQCVDYDSLNENDIYEYEIGPNDLGLMKRLCKAGTDHRKFMRMLAVYVDILAPLYWWKEFDTYRAGVKYLDDPNPFDIEMNSCSTMHCIHKKEFDISDFSFDHLINDWYDLDHADCVITSKPDDNGQGPSYYFDPWSVLKIQIDMLNKARGLYLETKDKHYWWQMIQLLPSSYNQKRTVMLNYEVLANIYKSRKDHKLDEWKEFCDWIRGLPNSELITGED